MKYLKKHIGKIVILATGLIVGLPILLTQTPFVLFDFSKTGHVGDTIGGIASPVIGIVSILLIYLTYNSQKEELHETKEELKMTRQTAERQQFDSTFFNSLRLYNQVVENISYGPEEATLIKSGRHAFDTIKTDLKDNTDKSSKKNFLESLSDYYENNKYDIGPFWKTFKFILNLIDSNKGIVEASKYIELFKSQVQYSEFITLYFLGALRSEIKIKKLLIEYDFFSDEIQEFDLDEEIDLGLYED